MSKKKTTILKFKYLLMLLSFSSMVIISIIYSEKARDFFIDDTKYDELILKNSLKYNIDHRFLKAVIYQESRFNASAVGNAGEIGLMQLMPEASVVDWARERRQPLPGKMQLFNPELNIEIGSWYLSKALKRWQGYKYDKELALCQYNAGESRANRWKPEDKMENFAHQISIDSTRSYVKNIMNKYYDYCDAAVN